MSDKYRAAIYCRFATEPEKKTAIYFRVASADDFAIKAQEDMLRSYATEKMFAVGEVYTDNGASGVTFDRPAFQKMMSEIERDEISCVIVKNTSRINRNYLQFGKWLDDMRAKKVRVIAVDDCFDSSKYTVQNILFEEAIKKYYKENHSQRIKAGIAHSRQRKLEQSAKPSE